ncbi:MAG: hypothetical protein GDA55_03395 [Cellvibrionales bacterium]|nr:hypothetical protein [Cellvibrionales bacterium]
MELLNDNLLEAFAHGFYGYGNLGSAVWFVGMEEGGGDSVGEINKRLEIWKRGGRQLTEDIAEYHQALGQGYYFSGAIKNQPTWNKLIRIVLAFQDKPSELVDVKAFQKSEFARRDSDNCLLELLPLPSPSTSHWLYGQASSLLWLRTRDIYKQHMLGARIGEIKKLIGKYGPRLVVFYGTGFNEHWRKIAGRDFKPLILDNKTAFYAKGGETCYFIAMHPVAHGVTKNYFAELGRHARLNC